MRPVEEEWLESFAGRVLAGLQNLELSGIHPVSPVRAQPAVFTDGWCVVIARLSSNDTIEAYVDTLTGTRRRMLWVGCIVKGPNRRSLRAAQYIAERWASPVTLYSDNAYTTEDGGYTYFRRHFTDFGRPIVELFEDVPNDIGIYWSDTIAWAKEPTRSLVRRSVRFLAQPIIALQSGL